MYKFVFVLPTILALMLSTADAQGLSNFLGGLFGGGRGKKGKGGGPGGDQCRPPPPPRGGNGFRGGNGQGLPPPLPLGNFTPVNLTCTASGNEPTCPADRDGVSGVWVCRQGIDPATNTSTTFSTCVKPICGISTDVCGCCNEECPVLCACKCDLKSTGDGLGVYVIDSGNGSKQICVPPLQALDMITHGDRFTCVSSCT